MIKMYYFSKITILKDANNQLEKNFFKNTQILKSYAIERKIMIVNRIHLKK